MQFQALFNPVGAKLGHDEQLLNNQMKQVQIAEKQQALESQRKLEALLGGLSTQQPQGMPAPPVSDPAADKAANLDQMIEYQKKQVFDYNEKAKALAAFPKVADQYRDAGNAAMEKFKSLVTEREKQRQEQMKFLQSVTGVMDNPEGFQDGLAQIESQFPNLTRQLGFKPDEQGRIAFTPENARIAKNIFEGSVDAVEKGRLAKAATDAIQREEEQRRREERDRTLERQRDQEIALSRARLERQRQEDEADRTKRVEEKQQKRQDTVTKEVQGTLNKNPVYKVFDSYKRANETATAVALELAKSGGYQNITTPQAMALVDSFRNLSTEYRSRTGGKYDAEMVKDLDGILQKTEKWFATIGKGDKRVSAETMVEIVQEMNKQYSRANKLVVMDEIKALENMQTRGVSPNTLMLKGDFKRFANQNPKLAKLYERQNADGETERMLEYKGRKIMLPMGTE